MKPFQIGINDEMSLWEQKRGVLLNKIVWYFLIIGIPTSITLWLMDGVPNEFAAYISALALIYIGLLVLNHKGHFTITALYIVIAGDLATCSAPILLGSDTNAQFLLLLIAGLPFLLFHKDWGNRRLLLAFMVFPMWVAVEWYCHSHEPVFVLKPWIIEVISYFYGAIVIGFSIYIFYHFTVQNERYALKIKEQRNLLDDKNKRLEQFSYMATHDLKTPIANIEGFFELLGMDLEDPNQEVQDSLDGISKSIAQAKSTIHDLIGVIKMVSLVEQVEDVNLQEVMEGVSDGLSLKIEEQKVDLEIDFSDCPTISFGKVSTRSILQNLVSNAIKYSSPERSPRIQVKSHTRGKHVVLSVEDNGLGIDMNTDGQKLFGMFKRIHTDAEGSGMGLFVIKSMVEDRGGRIEVNSELGKGSKFSVILPRIIIS